MLVETKAKVGVFSIALGIPATVSNTRSGSLRHSMRRLKRRFRILLSW